MSVTHTQLTQEVNALINELISISDRAKTQTARILNKNAKPLTVALFAAAPTSRATHYRYSTPKLVRRIRAKRGKGVRVASYRPGNLAGSFQILRFRNAKYSVIVGAKLAKGANTVGNFSASRPDGYYAHMVEKGTKNATARPFVAPTWQAMRGTVRTGIINDLQKTIKRIKK
jgi:HK97 gp10 family phage protein